MNQKLQVTAENVIEMLRSVQEKSPDNALRVFFSEKRTTENIGHLCRRHQMSFRKKCFHSC